MRKIILSLFSLWAIHAGAQSLTPDIQVNNVPVQYFNDGNTGVNDIPTISLGENGKTTIVWTQKMANNEQYKVYNRAYSEFDVPVGSAPTIVNNAPPGGNLVGDTATRVAADAAGNYIVVYMENNNTSATNPQHCSVYYHRYSANGTPSGGRVFVDYGMFPDIDIAPDGSFNIAYVRGHYYLSSNAVYVKRYTSAGTSLGVVTIDSYSSGTSGYYYAAVRSRNGNNFTSSFQKGNSASGASATIKTFSGTTLTSTTSVEGFIRTRNFIQKSNGSIVATSQRQINNSNGTRTYKPTAFRFLPPNSPVTTEMSVYNAPSNVFEMRSHTVGSNDNGDYVIAYPKYTNNVYQGMYVQQYNINDQAVGPAYAVSDTNNTMQAVSIDVAGCTFGVTWLNNGNVYYRRFKLQNNTTVALSGPSHFCTGSTATYTASFPNGTSGITNHTWQVQECTPAGVPVGNVLYSTQLSGIPSTWNLPSNWNLTCNKHYLFTLSVGNATCPQITTATLMSYVTCPPTLNFTDTMTICAGETASVNVSSSIWPVYVYANGQQIGAYNSSPITLNPTTTTTYTFEISDGLKKGCVTRKNLTVTVNTNCPTACFTILNVIENQPTDSYYGPIDVKLVCDKNLTIDGSCSTNESGYYIRIVEFDLDNWQYVGPDLYNGWVASSGQVPSSINLSTMILPEIFVEPKIYMIGLAVGPVWHSVNQFVRIRRCPLRDASETFEAKPLTAAETVMVSPNPTKGQVTLQLEKTASGTVTLHTMEGKRVSETSFSHSDAISLDLSRYTRGIYMATIVADGVVHQKKIIRE